MTLIVCRLIVCSVLKSFLWHATRNSIDLVSGLAVFGTGRDYRRNAWRSLLICIAITWVASNAANAMLGYATSFGWPGR